VTVIKPSAIGQGITDSAGPVQAAAPAIPLSVIKAPGLDEMQPSIYDTQPTVDIVDTKGKLRHQIPKASTAPRLMHGSAQVLKSKSEPKLKPKIISVRGGQYATYFCIVHIWYQNCVVVEDCNSRLAVCM